MSLAKQVIGGTGIVAVAGGAAKLLSLLTAPILTPILGPAPYGAAALVHTLTSLASMLALLGIDMAYARFYLQEEESQRASVERFCWRFSAIGTIVIALLTAGGFYWLGDRWLDRQRWFAAYLVIAIGLSVVVVMNKTRMRLAGNYGRIAVSIFLGAVVWAAVSIGAALCWRTDVWVLLSATAASLVTTFFVLGLPSISIILTPAYLSRKTKLAVISLGLAGSVTAPMYWVISSADRWFLSYYGNTAEIGVYTVANSVAMLGIIINSSLTLTWFPEASRVYGQKEVSALGLLGRMWSRLVAGLGIVWLGVAAAGGDVLRLLTAPAFHIGAQYIPWLAGGVFFYGLALLANTTLFLTAKMKFSAFLWIGGALVSVCFNFVLIPYFGALGAAMVQCASFGVTALGVFAVSRYLLPLPVPFFRLGIALLVSFCSGIAMAPSWAGDPMWSLAIKFPVGLMVAWIVFYIIAPDWEQRLRTELLRVITDRKA